MQRVIAEFRQRMGIPTPPPSPQDVDASTATGAGIASAPAAAHTAVEVAAPEGSGREAVPEVLPRYGVRVPCEGRESQYKKIPSREHREDMTAHARSCHHQGCGHVWNGPWGSFIGGPRGSTHFDLTDCAQGKRLNQLLGWNYIDPSR